MATNNGKTIEIVTAAPQHDDPRLVHLSVGRYGHALQRGSARELGELLIALADQADAAARAMPTAAQNAAELLRGTR